MTNAPRAEDLSIANAVPPDGASSAAASSATAPAARRARSPWQKRVRVAFLGLATLLAVGFAWTRYLVARAEAHYPPIGSFVDVASDASATSAARGAIEREEIAEPTSATTRVHYVERGVGSPVVLLHGIFGGVQDFAATLLDPIAARHRTLALDRPGHGWSERAPNTVTPREQARFVHAALRELRVERPLVLGFSFGGAVALAYALEFPDDTAGLVLVNPVLRAWPDPIHLGYRAAGLPLIGPILSHTWLTPMGTWLAAAGIEHSFAPAAIPPSFARSPVELSLRPATFRAIAEDMCALKDALTEMVPHWPEIRCSLVILVGEGDQVTWPSHHSYPLRDAVAGAEFVSVPGAGHQVLFTHTERVLAAFERLETLVAARAARK